MAEAGEGPLRRNQLVSGSEGQPSPLVNRNRLEVGPSGREPGMRMGHHPLAALR